MRLEGCLVASMNVAVECMIQKTKRTAMRLSRRRWLD